MDTRKIIVCALAVAVAGSASGFTLVEGYSLGHVTFASDEGGSVQLGPVEKVGNHDPVLTDFGNLVHGTFNRPNDIVNYGAEIDGTWTVDQFNALLYGVDLSGKTYGSIFASRIESAGFTTDIRFVWLSANALGGAYPYFAEDQFWLYPQAAEPNHRGGSNSVGPFDYAADVNLGFGYGVDDVATHYQDHWLLLYQEADLGGGVSSLTFRGGLHYSEIVTTTPVPEPVGLLAFGVGLVALMGRRRR